MSAWGTSERDRPLWKCPICGREFANANQWHSHGQSLDDYLADKTPVAVDLFMAFAAAVRECGDYRMHPAKTRVAFITRMSFAGATLRRDWIDVGFILPYRSDSPRFRRIEDYGMKHEWAHYLRISRVEEIDAEVRRWACDAYRVGLQEYPWQRGKTDG